MWWLLMVATLLIRWSTIAFQEGRGLTSSRVLHKKMKKVTLDGYDDQAFGYLLITVNTQRLQIEYRRSSGEILDSVVVDLQTRRRVASF